MNPLQGSFGFRHPIGHCNSLSYAIDKLGIDQRLDNHGNLVARGKHTRHSDATEWTLHVPPVCMNDCSYPLTCIDTGKCRCVQALCMLDDRLRLPPTSAVVDEENNEKMQANGGATLHAEKANEAKVDAWTNADLQRAVANTKLASVFHPGIAEFWSTRMKHWPSINIFSREAMGTTDLYKQVDSNPKCRAIVEGVPHSFSWDVLIYQMNKTQLPSDPNFTLWTAEFYQGCFITFVFANPANVMDQIAQSIRKLNPQSQDAARGKNLVFFLSHDYGGCLWFDADMRTTLSQYPSQPEIFEKAIIVQSMGDWHTLCVMPHKDIVAPPRPGVSPSLWRANMTSIKPMCRRPNIAFYAGKSLGAGSVLRNRLGITRLIFPTMSHLSPPNIAMTTNQYLQVIADTQFCLVPAGFQKLFILFLFYDYYYYYFFLFFIFFFVCCPCVCVCVRVCACVCVCVRVILFSFLLFLLLFFFSFFFLFFFFFFSVLLL
jgi:hypothetical protein